MKVIVLNTTGDVDRMAAEAILGQIVSKPDSVIGLSTGRTTLEVHRCLVNRCRVSAPVLSEVTFFGIDEVVNVPRDYSGACYTMLKTQVIDPLDIDGRNFLMLPTISDDFSRDCDRFMEEISRRGGMDFIFLGLGENAHLGFNQPGSSFESGCRVSDMSPELEERIRRETGTPDDVRLGGVTIGIADILAAGKLVLAAKGRSKAEAVRAMVEGPATEEVPASALQLHPDTTIILDKEAASLLKPESCQ